MVFLEKIGYQASKEDIINILSDVPIQPISVELLEKMMLEMDMRINHLSHFNHYAWISQPICRLAREFAQHKVDPARFARQFADR